MRRVCRGRGVALLADALFMILNTQERFSIAQSLIVGTGDTVSTNVYDTGANADAGIGESGLLQIQIGTAALSATGTIQFVLQCDDNVGFASPKEYPLTLALAQALLTAGTVAYQGKLPIGLERYLRVVYRVATAAFTQGTVNAYMSKQQQQRLPVHNTSVPGVK